MCITVYSTTSCGVCHALMKWLDSKDVPYRNVVVDAEENGIAELMTVSGGAIGVPFTVIEHDGATTTISGFDRGAFQRALI
jgi:glutaredoxin